MVEIRGIEPLWSTNVDEPLQHSQQLVFQRVPSRPDQLRAVGQSLGRAAGRSLLGEQLCTFEYAFANCLTGDETFFALGFDRLPVGVGRPRARSSPNVQRTLRSARTNELTITHNAA